MRNPIIIIVFVVGAVIAAAWYFYDKRPVKDGPLPQPPASVAIVSLTPAAGGNYLGTVVRGGDNAFYVAGTFSGTVAQQVSRGGNDVFVVKVDNSGHILWIKSFGGTGDDAPADIAVDPDGNPLVILNYTNQFLVMNQTLALQGGAASLALKLNKADGASVWFNTAKVQPHSGAGNIVFTDAEINAQGAIAIAGTCNAPCAFSSADNQGRTVSPASGSNAPFVCTYNSSGNLSQSAVYGTGNFSRPHICFDNQNHRLFTTFNYDGAAAAGSVSLLNHTNGMGYACLDGNLAVIPGSVHYDINSGYPGRHGKECAMGEVIQDASGQFFASGFSEDSVHFGNFIENTVQPNGFIMKIDPSTFEVTDGRIVNGDVNRAHNIALGAGNQILFTGEMENGGLYVYSQTYHREERFYTSPSAPVNNQRTSVSAYLGNYSNTLSYNWVRRTVPKTVNDNFTFGTSVGANQNKIAFTGEEYTEGTFIWQTSKRGSLPVTTETHTGKFLIVICDYDFGPEPRTIPPVSDVHPSR